MSLIDFCLNQTIQIKHYLRYGDGEIKYSEPESRRAYVEFTHYGGIGSAARKHEKGAGFASRINSGRGRAFLTGDPLEPDDILIIKGIEYHVSDCAVYEGPAPHLEVEFY